MKNLKGLLLSLILFTCTIFAACGGNPPPDNSLKVQLINAQSAAIDIQETENYFFNNIYESNNLDENLTYDSNMLSMIFTEFSGFIELGTITNGELKTITFGPRTYNVQEEKEIKIGNNIKYKDKVVYVSENKIYANKLVLMIELENETTFKLNSLSCVIPYNEEKVNAAYNLTYKFGSDNIVDEINENEYNIEINTVEDHLKLYYDYSSSYNRVKIIKSYNDKIEYELIELDYDSDNHVEYLKVNLDNTNPEYSVTYDFVFGYVNTISLKFNVKNNTIS